MMHKKNFVAAIRINGRVLRESSDRVELPFGSEYSILLKNLDTVRIQAQISIDGRDATGWLVINPNQSIDVERFCRDNREQGHRFKFIERTKQIENHRGIEADDGLVRVEFKREKVYELPKIVEHHTYHYHDYYYPWRPYYPWYPYYPTTTWTTTATVTNAGLSGMTQSQQIAENRSSSTFNCTASMMRPIEPNENGITVDGTISNQQFVSVSGFNCENSEVLILRLVGRQAGKEVKVAKTVNLKPQCPTCNKKNKGTAKFCSVCGTNLEKV